MPSLSQSLFPLSGSTILMHWMLRKKLKNSLTIKIEVSLNLYNHSLKLFIILYIRISFIQFQVSQLLIMKSRGKKIHENYYVITFPASKQGLGFLLASTALMAVPKTMDVVTQ